MYCPGGNASDPIWRVLVSSGGISCWTPLKPQHSKLTLTLIFFNTSISTLNSGSLKPVDKFTYLGSSVSSTENDINMRLAKAWTAIHRSSVILKSDLSQKINSIFFQTAVVSILLYGCTTLMLTKPMEKNLTAVTQECYELYWTNSGSNIPQNSSCTANYLPSLKPSK